MHNRIRPLNRRRIKRTRALPRRLPKQRLCPHRVHRRDIAGFFNEGVRGVVNNSRGILTAHKGKSEDARFTDHTRKAVLDMKQDILQWLK